MRPHAERKDLAVKAFRRYIFDENNQLFDVTIKSIILK